MIRLNLYGGHQRHRHRQIQQWPHIRRTRTPTNRLRTNRNAHFKTSHGATDRVYFWYFRPSLLVFVDAYTPDRLGTVVGEGENTWSDALNSMEGSNSRRMGAVGIYIAGEYENDKDGSGGEKVCETLRGVV